MRKNHQTLHFFFFALLASLFGRAAAPNLILFYFAPYLARLYIRYSFHHALWGSFLSGAIMDFFSASTPIGFFSLGYTLLCFLVFRHRRFFNEKAISLPLYTFYLSFVFSFIQIALVYLFQKNFYFSFKLFISDMIIMPLLDSIYCILWFIVPVYLLHYMKRRTLLFLAKRR